MKTRTVQRSRLVPHTVDGRTELVLDRYEEEQPAPPRDLDHAVLNAVTGGATLLVAISVAWSTVSIGDLLARTVPTPSLGYGAALAFDVAWIMCMALEWLSRYDAARARLYMGAGHAALAVAVAAVVTHGIVEDQVAGGVLAAAVSVLAKATWALVMRQHAKVLDPLTEQWVDKQRAKAGAQLAMVPVRRQLARMQAAVAAETAALDTAQARARAEQAQADADPDRPDDEADDEDGNVLPLVGKRLTVKDAVRTAVDSGLDDADAVLRYVRTAADPNVKSETVARYLRAARIAG
ncbi:hypothetical protein GA0115251_106919 [Streptomyces sp. TverLS-915]|uniref:protein transporter Sec31 n=1 Tax=Streptomyces sp. TverLS-915 TaxID=1839763 RepID=UPI00081EF6C5|nr:protein transporter Sec31 [Streptomyces sp. TverLS-915]SCD40945.1 hypothetical protein GA0115251_106919 [Streptomyces sp. TverLS-915]